MNTLRKYSTLIFISLLSLSSLSALAVTLVDEPNISTATSDITQYNVTLSARYQNGELHTSKGIIKLTPGVKVDDQRAVDDWYRNPTNTKISLFYQGKRLKKVVIY